GEARYLVRQVRLSLCGSPRCLVTRFGEVRDAVIYRRCRAWVCARTHFVFQPRLLTVERGELRIGRMLSRDDARHQRPRFPGGAEAGTLSAKATLPRFGGELRVGGEERGELSVRRFERFLGALFFHAEEVGLLLRRAQIALAKLLHGRLGESLRHGTGAVGVFV